VSSLLLGVGIGTASSKGVLVRDDGTVIAAVTRACAKPSTGRNPGQAESV
jgi:sugar (pentulose or hexulose) kinase